MGDVQIKVITELSQFESLFPVYEELRQKCRGENSIYLTHEWLSTWWKHFGVGKKIYTFIIEKENRVIGVVPLIENVYRFGFIRIRAFESFGTTSCNYVGLILPENLDEAVSAFLTFFKDNFLSAWAVLRLSLIPAESQLFSTLKNHIHARPPDFYSRQIVKTLAPYAKLPATWEEYYRWIGSNRRSALSRASRAFTQAKGKPEFLKVDSKFLDEALDQFFDLHQERWNSAGIRSVFNTDRAREFYREVAGKFLLRHWLDFSCLIVDHTIVSACFGCIYRDKYCAMTYARNLRYSRYSLGHLHHMYLFQEAIRQKLPEFDFLQGTEPYKFYWTRLARRYLQVLIIQRGKLPPLRLKLINLFIRFCEIRTHGLREMIALYLLNRREKIELRRMGLSRELAKLKSL